MNVLIISLGKGKKENDNRYVQACYRFSDGYTQETAFFGFALHLRAVR